MGGVLLIYYSSCKMVAEMTILLINQPALPIPCQPARLFPLCTGNVHTAGAIARGLVSVCRFWTFGQSLEGGRGEQARCLPSGRQAEYLCELSMALSASHQAQNAPMSQLHLCSPIFRLTTFSCLHKSSCMVDFLKQA